MDCDVTMLRFTAYAPDGTVEVETWTAHPDEPVTIHAKERFDDFDFEQDGPFSERRTSRIAGFVVTFERLPEEAVAWLNRRRWQWRMRVEGWAPLPPYEDDDGVDAARWGYLHIPAARCDGDSLTILGSDDMLHMEVRFDDPVTR